MLKLGAQTWPPLGQVTVAPPNEGDIDFTAILQVPTLDADLDWSVSLWYAVDGQDWQESTLESIESLDVRLKPEALDHMDSSSARLYFAKSIQSKKTISFTLRYRHSSQVDWIWARDQLGLDDGRVFVQSSSSPSENLQDYIKDLDSEWKISSCLCQTPKTQLWMLEAAVQRPKLNRGESDDDRSTFKDIRIGTPKTTYCRWFALVRHSTAWLAPRHGKDTFALDKDAILCAFLLENGRYLVFLGCSGVNDVLTVLQSTSVGELLAHARSDGSGSYPVDSRVLVSESLDLGCAIAAVIYKTRELFHMSRKITMDYQAEEAPLYGNSRFHPEWYEDWHDGLGYCTWNALGQELTEQKVIEALESLEKSNISITNLILDDNWQSLDRSGADQFSHSWNRFEADPESFPRGLKATITTIRDKHPSIQHVAVWHALLGYWGGISPSGDLAKKYKTISLERKDSHLGLDDRMTVIDDNNDENVETFYKDFYSFLSDCGIDSVKTDVQAMLDTWTSSKARRDLLCSYLDSWSLAALKYFQMRAISCMSLFPHGMFYTQNNSMRPSFPVRTSDDYFPNEPDSHAWHLWTNAHNCVMMQDLNIVPDWDMFQTKHEWGAYHAAARCISGGPIYITDEPGRHDLDLIKQITGKTPRGKTVTFRPSVVAKAVDPFVGFHDNSLLKVGSYHGASQTGTSILGIFNVSKRFVTELIPISAFPGLVPSQDYVVQACSTGRVSSPTSSLCQNPLLSLTLETQGYEIFSAYPLTSLQGQKADKVQIATLGLMGKMTGCAALVSHSIVKQDNGRLMIDTRVKAFGTLGVYISNLPDLRIESDFMITIHGRPVPRSTVETSIVSEHVLEVDVEKAWNDMGLESGWSNEIEVKINVGA